MCFARGVCVQLQGTSRYNDTTLNPSLKPGSVTMLGQVTAFFMVVAAVKRSVYIVDCAVRRWRLTLKASRAIGEDIDTRICLLAIIAIVVSVCVRLGYELDPRRQRRLRFQPIDYLAAPMRAFGAQLVNFEDGVAGNASPIPGVYVDCSFLCQSARYGLLCSPFQ